jgi:hypothetical protein
MRRDGRYLNISNSIAPVSNLTAHSTLCFSLLVKGSLISRVMSAILLHGVSILDIMITSDVYLPGWVSQSRDLNNSRIRHSQEIKISHE